MAMSLKDLSQMKGLMALSNSDNDGEALNAIRAANRLLVKNGLTWDMFFRRTVTVMTEVEAVSDGDEDIINDAFEEALRDAHGTFRETLLSIQAQWSRTHHLSERQRRVMLDAASRAR